MQLPQIQQQDFGPCPLVKISGCIRGITKQPFVVHFMMELNLLHPEPESFLAHLHACLPHVCMCVRVRAHAITLLFIMELYKNMGVLHILFQVPHRDIFHLMCIMCITFNQNKKVYYFLHNSSALC